MYMHALRCWWVFGWNRWFHGGITSGAAKEKLKVQSEGSFLVRESQTKEETFVLSVKTGPDDVTEVIINKTVRVSLLLVSRSGHE